MQTRGRTVLKMLRSVSERSRIFRSKRMNSRTPYLAPDLSISYCPTAPYGLALKERKDLLRIHVHVKLLGNLVEPGVNAVTGFGAALQQLIEKARQRHVSSGHSDRLLQNNSAEASGSRSTALCAMQTEMV